MVSMSLKWHCDGHHLVTGNKEGREQHGERTVTSELQEMKLTWGGVQHVANEGNKWRKLIAASCPKRDEED